jgi:hypothetical protein
MGYSIYLMENSGFVPLMLSGPLVSTRFAQQIHRGIHPFRHVASFLARTPMTSATPLGLNGKGGTPSERH